MSLFSLGIDIKDIHIKKLVFTKALASFKVNYKLP